ncbi:unnamed protein product [Scytosiphon promiscuus]
MDKSDGFDRNRRASYGYGEAVLRLMSSAPDGRWAEWLKTPFERAAALGDAGLTTALMKAGADGNALIPAVSHGHHTLVRTLLEMGASTSKKDEDGLTPLLVAARDGRGRMVRTLLIEGADVNEPDGRGRSPLHLACISGDPTSVQALLAAGSDASHRHDPSGNAALDFAVWEGKNEASRVLLGKGVDINARSRQGRTALHVAVLANQANAIRFLAHQTGIQTNCEDVDGLTPLHLAANRGSLVAVEALVDSGVNVEHRSSRYVHASGGSVYGGFSPLDFAAFRGYLEVVKALVWRGAGVRAVSGARTSTALHSAAAGNNVDVIKFLIRAGAAVDGPMRYWTPLHCAVEANQTEAVLALAQCGANLNYPHAQGSTPLGQAALQANGAMVNALLSAGANPNVTYGAIPALHTAARSSYPGSEEIVRVLLEHGADAKATWNQEQALHGAVVQGTSGIIDLLITYQADVNGYPCDLSPLHVACNSTHCSSHHERVSTLLSHGANVLRRDVGWNSALHMAAANRSPEMVDLLLRAGADETALNEDAHTPATQVRRTYINSASDKEMFDRILRLLDGAPRDRAWRRRGFLVLCCTFPANARLESTLRTRAELPRASKMGAAARRGGDGKDGGGGVLALTAQNGSFNNLLARLFRVGENGIFRKIVCFL